MPILLSKQARKKVTHSRDPFMVFQTGNIEWQSLRHMSDKEIEKECRQFHCWQIT